MSKRYLLPVFAALLTATPAFAAPVFMLQFGSFETREEADAKLRDVSSKHGGVLAKLSTSVREVTLPPDNLTVYRTQAGPLNTRNDAQSICSQLASNGDECYVVETAMMAAPAATATPVVAQVAPVAPTIIPTFTPAPAAPVVIAPVVADTAPAPTLNVAALEDKSIPLTGAAPLAAAPTAPIVVDAPVVPTLAEAKAAPKTTEQEMQQALNNAVERQKSGAITPTPISAETQQAEAEANKPSFWSKLNPFSSDDDTRAAAPVAAAANPVVVPPVVQTAAADTPSLAPLVEETAPAKIELAAAPTPSVSAPIVVNATPAETPAPLQPLVIDTTARVATEAQPYPLPPPPAPLTAKESRTFSAPSVPVAPITVPPATPVIVSATPEPVGVLVPSSSPAPKMADATVRVEEAKRVPLSEYKAPTMPAPAVLAVPTTVVPSTPAVLSLSPSATLGQKTLWAQVGWFTDAQTALAFWERYRLAHPDFPAVRVRVTSPLAAQHHGVVNVSLRVGPFAREGFIRNLCTSIQKDGIVCGPITDMGIASDPYANRKGFLPQSRYRRR